MWLSTRRKEQRRGKSKSPLLAPRTRAKWGRPGSAFVFPTVIYVHPTLTEILAATNLEASSEIPSAQLA
jgi:hypothetical protein